MRRRRRSPGVICQRISSRMRRGTANLVMDRFHGPIVLCASVPSFPILISSTWKFASDCRYSRTVSSIATSSSPSAKRCSYSAQLDGQRASGMLSVVPSGRAISMMRSSSASLSGPWIISHWSV